MNYKITALQFRTSSTNLVPSKAYSSTYSSRQETSIKNSDNSRFNDLSDNLIVSNMNAENRKHFNKTYFSVALDWRRGPDGLISPASLPNFAAFLLYNRMTQASKWSLFQASRLF